MTTTCPIPPKVIPIFFDYAERSDFFTMLRVFRSFFNHYPVLRRDANVHEDVHDGARPKQPKIRPLESLAEVGLCSFGLHFCNVADI
jgi:hypothetical protein